MPPFKLIPEKSLLCPEFDGYKLSSASGQVKMFNKPVSEGNVVTDILFKIFFQINWSNFGSYSFIFYQKFCLILFSGLNDSESKGASYLQTRLDGLHNCLSSDADSFNTSDGGEGYSTVYCFNKLGHLLAFDYSTVSETEFRDYFIIGENEQS